MFRKSILLTGMAAIALAGCDGPGQQESVEAITTVDVAEPPANSYGFMEGRAGDTPPPPPPVPQAASEAAEAAADAAAEDMSAPAGAGTIPVGIPQIAYRFAYGFRLPNDAIKPLQERHADMCEARGPDVCRIISMKQADSEGDYAYGSLHMAVASKDARAFGKDLSEASGKVDGELVSSSIDGEDLSKRIVDTEARLRARTVLRDRLMDVLRTRRGTVAELVEAERGVAQVNEEIDQARSWLAEMKNRVAYSQMHLTYESGTRSSGGFVDPIRDAWSAIGATLGGMIGFLIRLIATLLPIGLLVWLLVWAFRKSGLRTPFARQSAEEDGNASE